MASIAIKSSDRACFFGRTGSGKTTLAKNLLRLSTAFTVLDAKHTYREEGIPIVRDYKGRLPRQIIRPPFEDEQKHWNAVINRCWRDGNQILYADEVTLINQSRTALSPVFGKAIRTGRERNLGVWSGSQRPKDIPSAIFTEAEHFFIFQLQYEADRDKVASFTGDAIAKLLPRLRGHQFVYYNVIDDHYELMELKIRKRRNATHRS